MAVSSDAIAEWRSFWFLPFRRTRIFHFCHPRLSIGPFIEPLQQAFGSSRAQISIGLTISSFISAIFCIPVGILVDRTRAAPRGPDRGAPDIGGVSAARHDDGNDGEFGGTVGHRRLRGARSAATVWTSAVASRFEASAGLAFAVTLSGASLSAAVFPVLATWLIGAYGWRIASGHRWDLGCAGLSVPAVVLPRCRDDGPGTRDDNKPGEGAEGVTLWQGLRSRTLYKLLMASGLFSFTAIGAVVHFVPILTDSGAAPLAAAGIAALVGVFSIVGRVGHRLSARQISGHVIGALAFMLPIVAAVLLLLDGADPFAGVAAAALGLTVGSEVDVIAFLAAEHFRTQDFRRVATARW